MFFFEMESSNLINYLTDVFEAAIWIVHLNFFPYW
jgi:hypothetical protein